MVDMFDLTGKKAIVTGGTRGLGHGVAEGLMEAGAEVVLIGSSERVYVTEEEFFKRGLKVHAVQADLGSEDQLTQGFEKAITFLNGQLDILVTAAGVQRRYQSEEFPWKEWEYVLDVNLTAVFKLCQLAGKIMLKQGSGKIINFASMLTFFGGYTVPAYAASKGGVAQLTKALSNEWAGKGINVNAVAPGYMVTEMNTNILNNDVRNASITARIPKGRWGTPDDMKGICIFLASHASDYINGAVIPVDGGYLGC